MYSLGMLSRRRPGAIKPCLGCWDSSIVAADRVHDADMVLYLARIVTAVGSSVLSVFQFRIEDQPLR